MATVGIAMSRSRFLGGLGRFTNYGRGPRHHLFHSTALKKKIQPYLLADIGEDNIAIQRYYSLSSFPRGCMAKVGQPLLDIDMEDGDGGESSFHGTESATQTSDESLEDTTCSSIGTETHQTPSATLESSAVNSGQVLPAVRRMIKEHGLDLKNIPATGKGGRVMKADVQRYLALKNAGKEEGTPVPQTTASTADTVLPLSGTESQMFKVMTDTLTIPHFGFTHSVDMTTIESIRRKCNAKMELVGQIGGKPATKITTLPIIMKALSMAFKAHPKLNSHLEAASKDQKPRLILKVSHNFGIAVDTPNGLLVPVVKDVQNRSVMSIADEINDLSFLAKEGALKPHHLTGATFTVSNIGSIGGSVVSPIIVPPMVGIVAIGKIEDVPVLVNDKAGQIQNHRKAVLSWSADHRVLDGASVARCANLLSSIIEEMDGVGFALM